MVLSLLPIDVQGNLGEERFTDIEAFQRNPSNPFLADGEGAWHRNRCRLEELRPTPGTASGGAVDQSIPPTAPGMQTMMFDNHCSGRQGDEGYRRPTILFDDPRRRFGLQRVGQQLP